MSRPTRHHLRILATSDLHMQWLPFDYAKDAPSAHPGLLGLAARIAALRGPDDLLVDNGDALQGGALGDGQGPHPFIATMNQLRYDAMTLGNHELDLGCDWLRARVREAAFPILCASLFDMRNTPLLPPRILLDRSLDDLPIRIGITGAMPVQIMAWNRSKLDGFTARPLRDTIAKQVAALRAEGADLVLVLGHSGLDPAPHSPTQENAGLTLAQIDGVDALVLGHQHRRFPDPGYWRETLPGADHARGTLHGVPTVMPGVRGAALGVIELALNHAQGRWSVTKASGRLEEGTADPEAALAQGGAAAQALHNCTRTHLAAPLGACTAHLHSYFAVAAPDPTLALIADAARTAYTGPTDQPILVATAPFSAGGLGGPDNYVDIAPGPLSLRTLGELYEFHNHLEAVPITGAQLQAMLNQSAQIFAGGAGHDGPLLRTEAAAHDFEVIHGLTYTIDIAQKTPFIRTLAHNGQPVRATDRFTLLVSDYRAASADFPGPAPIWRADQPMQECIANYLRASSPVTPDTPRLWRFAPTGGSRLLTSSPKARPFAPAQGIEWIGPGEGGFDLYRVRL